MNGFSILSDTYQKAAEKGTISQERAKRYIKIYDFLAACNNEELCILFDSGAFNDIANGYISAAAKALTKENVIDEEQGAAIREKFSFLLEEKTSANIANQTKCL